jgi:ATP-binding cassette subfamily B protein
MRAAAQPYIKLLTTYLRPQWRRSVLLLLLLLGGIGLELLNPQILGSFIDNALAGSPLSLLLRLGGLFLAVALFTQLLSVGESYLAADIGLAATNELRADLALHCLLLDPSFHNEHSPGELIQRVDGDVALLANFFARFVVQLLGSGLLLIGVLVQLWRIEWRSGLALTVFALVTLVVIGRLRNVAVPAWEAAREGSARLFGLLEERLGGTEDIRANGGTGYVMVRFFEQERRLWRQELKGHLLGTGSHALGQVLFAAGTALALGIGVYLYGQGAITVGTIYLLYRYTELVNRPIEQINRQIQELQQAAAGLNRILALLQVRSRISDGDRTLAEGALGVIFDGVSFGYEAEEPIVGDISFELEPGAIVGLLGRTGSGKTTLIRLLFRFFDPSAGAIYLGNADLRSLQLAEVRRRVGMVTQEIQLFHASVRDNLTFFDPSIEDERIREALEELGLGSWLESLPDGLNTRLAPGGRDLSAGQAQLLAFARVFLKDPDVVVLDEASSRLDAATERLVEEALERLLAGRTAIIIAHRLATVQRADQIMILEKGRIAEYGRRAELAADPTSRFAGLMRVGLEEALA